MSAAASPILSPRTRQAGGCCLAAVAPDLSADRAVELAATFRALADPTRLRILDVLRMTTPEAVCQCELTPLFGMSQQALSRHLKVLGSAGLIESERRGLWTYYYLPSHRTEEVLSWLG